MCVCVRERECVRVRVCERENTETVTQRPDMVTHREKIETVTEIQGERHKHMHKGKTER